MRDDDEPFAPFSPIPEPGMVINDLSIPPREMHCELCHADFLTNRPPCAVRAEAEAVFSSEELKDLAVVCDPCYKLVRKWMRLHA